VDYPALAADGAFNPGDTNVLFGLRSILDGIGTAITSAG
jgi:hypothetical protein